MAMIKVKISIEYLNPTAKAKKGILSYADKDKANINMNTGFFEWEDLDGVTIRIPLSNIGEWFVEVIDDTDTQD
jgi:hypothetical protein